MPHCFRPMVMLLLCSIIPQTVTDPLSDVFGAADRYEVVSIESEEFTVNPDFDGKVGTDGDIELLQGDDRLLIGEDGTIYS